MASRRFIFSSLSTTILSVALAVRDSGWSSFCSPAAVAEANDDATGNSWHGRSWKAWVARTGFDSLPPSSVHRRGSTRVLPGRSTVSPAVVGDVRRSSSKAYSTPQRPNRGGHGGSDDHVSNGSTSPSVFASSVKKRRRVRARKTRAAQRKTEARGRRRCLPNAAPETTRRAEDARKDANSIDSRQRHRKQQRRVRDIHCRSRRCGTREEMLTGDASGDVPRSPRGSRGGATRDGEESRRGHSEGESSFMRKRSRVRGVCGAVFVARKASRAQDTTLPS